LEKGLHLLGREAAGEAERRDPGTVQDLVRVGVADAAQDVRIGQGALQRVALRRERSLERSEVRLQHLQAAGIEGRQRRFSRDEVERGPLLAAGFGEQQRAGWEIEGGQADLPGHLGATRLPLKTARDHQVQHCEPFPLEADHDALAQPSKPLDTPPQETLQRRLDRPQQERAAHPRPLQRLAADPRPQRLKVDFDVGKLGHAGSVKAGGGRRQAVAEIAPWAREDHESRSPGQDRGSGDHESRFPGQDRDLGDHESRFPGQDRDLGDHESRFPGQDRDLGGHESRFPGQDGDLGGHESRFPGQDRDLGGQESLPPGQDGDSGRREGRHTAKLEEMRMRADLVIQAPYW
jgi:hypothetical protein